MADNGSRVDIFLSHAGRDRAWAEWAAWHLVAAGWSVELDVWDWPPGDNFMLRITEALSRADQMVALWSAAYFERPYTTYEWTACAALGRQLVPLRIEPVDPPDVLRPIIFRDLYGLEAAHARQVLLSAVTGADGPPPSAPSYPGPGRSGRSGGSGRSGEPSEPRLPGSLPNVWNVPPRSITFVGRDDLLLFLRERMGAARTAIHALHGIGGVGKTALAAEYAYRFAGHYQWVWWVNAEQVGLIGEQLAAFAVEVGRVGQGIDIPTAVAELRRWARQRSGWLLIMDNAEGVEQLAEWLLDGPGHTVITSRSHVWREVAEPIEVDVCARGDSVALLRAHVATLSERDAANLAEALGDLPLALAQAAGVLAATAITPADYLIELGRRPSRLLEVGKPVRYREPLVAAVRLSVRRLAELSPAAWHLLQVCAFIAAEPMSLDVVSTADTAALAPPLAEVARSPLALGRAAEQLGRLGLARIGERSILVHPLVRTIVRDDLPEAQRDAIAASLAPLLLARYERTGALAELYEAISIAGQALEVTNTNSPDRARLLSVLSSALLARYQREGAMVDLQEAARVADQAVDATAVDHPDRARQVAVLAEVLATRYERTGALADLDGAIDSVRTCIGTLPAGHPDLAGLLTILASTLTARHGRTGAPDDLDEAIVLARRAVTESSDDHPERAERLAKLASALMARFGRTNASIDLDDAITAARTAVAAILDDHPVRARVDYVLASALLARHRHYGDARTRAEAVSLLRQAAQADVAAPLVRVQCAQLWASTEGDAGAWSEAVTAWRQVQNLTPLLVEHGLDPSDRQHHLSLLAGAGRHAAAAAVRAGDLHQAWAMLESGRGVLLGEVQATRSDLAKLRDHDPRLAARIDSLRALLNAGAQTVEMSARRRQAAHDFRELLTTIRGLPGFERFGRLPSIDDLRGAAADGPIVAVNLSRHGCDALILTVRGVDRVALPGLSEADATGMATKVSTGLRQLGPQGWPEARRLMGDVMAWLWDAVAGPVLDHLGYTATPAPGAPWPRLWWIPTGAMAALPLHAAGHHDDSPGPRRRSVLDRAISSYAPTARMLHYSRGQSTPDTRRLVVVGVSNAPDLEPLWFATREATLIAQLTQAERMLVDDGATVAAVRAELQHATWAHFACHATPDKDPAESHLALTDGRLTVRELSTMDLSGAWLAYLSGCTTAHSGPLLYDESIHVASALQAGGFQHVIASLWPVVDGVALWFARHIYRELLAHVSPALAVHHALQAARDRYREYPWLWAPYLHFGP